MGKKKKKTWKKVNPEKSNKMIIAVAAGLFLLLVVFLLLIILNTGSEVTPENKGKVMEDTLKYVKRNQGVSAVKCYPEENKVVIVYESYNTEKQDFPKIARYAGLLLSNKMSHETLTVILAKEKEEKAIHSFSIRGGRVIEEKVITPSN
jgi:hypothetical protein